MMFNSVLLCCLLLGVVICTPESVQNDEGRGSSVTSDEHSMRGEHSAPLEKRSPRYDFGLGKRAYSYVSEYKRLPVYNFGLGKRSRLYSFGLGKRSVDEDQPNDDLMTDSEKGDVPEAFDQYEDAEVYEIKRARPYSFGLGKRLAEAVGGDYAGRYASALGKRPQLYNFGLGKRLGKYGFGLGKRQRDMHRFSFGLGKRSDAVANADYADEA